MKKAWNVLICVLCLMVCMLPAGIAVAASTEIYVSAAGSDATGDGSQANPYATLSKAAEVANASATKTVNVYVMSDLTSTACARFNDHDVTFVVWEQPRPRFPAVIALRRSAIMPEAGIIRR